MAKAQTNAEQESGAVEFPKHSLENALKIAEAIEDRNSGNPLPPTDVAIALDKSPGSSDFRILLSSSIKYGLTTGSYNQSRVSLTELGKNIAEPTNEEQKRHALYEAAFRPEVFRRIFEAYKGKKVPDAQFFYNALVRDFGIARAQAQKCASVFVENAGYLGLIKRANTGDWFGSAPDWASAVVVESEAGMEDNTEEQEESVEITPSATAVSLGPARPVNQAKNAIFVGHGKNKTPLQQLEKFLTEYKIPHKVAIDEPNRGRPISQKVADLMKECGAAIVIFTADEEFKKPSGETIYRPSENAIFELGAAGALYGSRIVVFKESGVDFPTNFRDIGYIEFEKDKLDAKVNELFRELISFGLLTVSVGAGS
jgi:predicted nucleotide-binding protein